MKRNGVPLGANDSLRRNLSKAFGACSPSHFWKHWNPIWGYYLAGYVYLPLRRYLPQPLATLVTFCASGVLHDLAIGLLGQGWQGFISLWFFCMGLFLVVSQAVRLDYGKYPFIIRVGINLVHLLACFVCAVQIRDLVLN